MDGRRTSPTRTKATWKPRVDEADPRFLREGDATLLRIDSGQPAAFREPGRSPVAVLPYQNGVNAVDGADGLAALPLLEVDALPEGVELDYAIVGGYDANAVEVRWRLPSEARGPEGEPLTLRWVMLKTFTGLQVKYPLPGKKPPLVFALADEDAYVYCDEPTCKECTFRCKQGLVLYAALDGLGIVRLPLSPNRR